MYVLESLAQERGDSLYIDLLDDEIDAMRKVLSDDALEHARRCHVNRDRPVSALDELCAFSFYAELNNGLPAICVESFDGYLSADNRKMPFVQLLFWLRIRLSQWEGRREEYDEWDKKRKPDEERGLVQGVIGGGMVPFVQLLRCGKASQIRLVGELMRGREVAFAWDGAGYT